MFSVFSCIHTRASARARTHTYTYTNIYNAKLLAMSLLDDIKTKYFNFMDMFKEWKGGDYQKKL